MDMNWSGTARSQFFPGAMTPSSEDDKMERQREKKGYFFINDEFSLTPIITAGSGDYHFSWKREKKKLDIYSAVRVAGKEEY